MSDDLKKLTVSALKELARKHVGKGFSRLKTKAELLAALKKVAPPPAEPASSPVPAPVRGRPAQVTRFQKPQPTNGAASPSLAPVVHGSLAAIAEPQPVTEGFFVVRVAGPREAERHHLTESSGAPRSPAPPPHAGYDEQLGELPDVYEDDAELLLPRDPHTLFFLWDFARDTRQGALAGLQHPRARLRVYDHGDLVRELDFALESKSYYVHGLTPGRSYRVEACFVGDGGEVRRLGRGSNVIALPAEGPSSDLEVRFMRIPWDVPLSRIKELLRLAKAAHERMAPPPRVPLPSSQSSRGLVGGEGETGSPSGRRWVPSRSGRP